MNRISFFAFNLGLVLITDGIVYFWRDPAWMEAQPDLLSWHQARGAIQEGKID